MLDVDDSSPQYRAQCQALGLTDRDRAIIRRIVYFYLRNNPGVGLVQGGGMIPLGGFPSVPMPRLNAIYVRDGEDVKLIAIEPAP